MVGPLVGAGPRARAMAIGLTKAYGRGEHGRGWFPSNETTYHTLVSLSHHDGPSYEVWFGKG